MTGDHVVMSRWFQTYGFAEVLDGLVIGAYPLDGEDVATLERLGIQRVLNLTEDQDYQEGAREAVEDALDEAGIEEYRLRLPDYGSLPPDALEAAVAELSGWLDDGVRTYLHCRAGWQRSPAVAAALISARDGVDVEEALEFVHARKPTADPLPHQRDDLRRWWEGRQTRDGG
jgi:protein-tyrosine phosphatase